MTALRNRIDLFALSILGVAATASLLPCRGQAADGLALVTNLGIALLFFWHGARLEPSAVRSAVWHWRLHAVILLSTFVMFPLLGLALKPLSAKLLPPQLAGGLMFLCVVPSTVQSSIAFTAVARGNVAAATCSASTSNVLGLVLTPALAQLTGLTLAANTPPKAAALSIIAQLLLPFVLGQLCRPRLHSWIERRSQALRTLDQCSILLVIYGAFSRAMVEHVWSHVPLQAVAALVPLTSLLLGCSLLTTWHVSRLLGFTREDRITALFCGSKKSLASGAPLANVLFPAHLVSAAVLPLVLFHQLQLLVCALLAQRYGAEPLTGKAVA